MSDRLRSWMVHHLGGVTVEEAQADRRELADMTERERERAQEARERLRRHEDAIAAHLRSHSPIACPECGSTDLFELMRLPEKVQVRCVPNDHRSFWTGEGLPLVPYQEMLARIQREQVAPLQQRFRAEREDANALRAVIRQANQLGVIYEDFDRVVILHDDIDTTEVVHPDVVRRLLPKQTD